MALAIGGRERNLVCGQPDFQRPGGWHYKSGADAHIDELWRSDAEHRGHHCFGKLFAERYVRSDLGSRSELPD